MNNLHEYIGLIIAIIVVLIVIAAQIYSFLKTKKKISELEGLFEDVDNLSLKETSITSGILQNKSSLQKFLQNIPSRYSDEDDSGDEIYRFVVDSSSKQKYLWEIRIDYLSH